MKTTEELLQPRILVIDKYPHSPCKVGDILVQANPKHAPRLWKPENTTDNTALVSNPEEYPNLFRPLKWWQERLIVDMPVYLKNDIGMVYEVDNYHYNGDIVWCRRPGFQTSCLNLSQGYLKPATKDEYEAYKQSLSKGGICV